MKLLACLFCTICAFLSLSLFAQNKIQVSSPSGNILFSFKLVNKSAMYSVSFKGKTIIDYSALSLKFDNGLLGSNLKVNKPIFRDTTEDYELVTGKTKQVHTHYKELTIPLEEASAPSRKINIVVRAFDDGIAFRYSFPQQNNWSSFSLLDENTTFKLTGDPMVHTLFRENYTTSHEGFYSSLSFSKIKQDTLMDMPSLFDFGGDVFMAITEAELLDYAGMYLSKQSGALVSKLSPLPGQQDIKVKAVLPHQSPWRVLMISDRIGSLIESNILTSLNEPCRIKDVSWIKPGKTTFPWWNGNVTPDTLNAPGNNFVTARYYIDFCARNHIEYHSVVEYGLHQWYVDDGVDFQPGPHSDVTRAVPGLDMKQVCDYAKSKGVGVRVWVHWAALYPRLDSAFAIFEKWGLSGMMVDFMDRDDQQMVNIQTEIVQKAAAHHLHVQFHGAYKPTGLNRTYPNEFTREGTLNYEDDKWDDQGLPPDHDINMPFTRMLAGSTDYHLGGFRAATKETYRVQYTRPLVLGTRCHMLAMYVVLENYLQMVCDYPAAYEDQPGFEFIREIPTTWDETRVIDAKVCEYITIARRKNNDWFVGTITDHQPREITVPLTFLKDGTYRAEIYTDASDVDKNPNNLLKQTRTVTNNDVLELHVAGGGGEVMRIRKE
ncbi:MAG: glycoside hydrolase family 97 protein [Bacteroidota bacterium]|nr:glycoside hydrolase family 97 protein [Bacteroidota bacterium]